MLADIGNILKNTSQLIITAFVCSFTFFLIGLLVGALCYHLATRSCNLKHLLSTSTPSDTPEAPPPVVYEEVAHNSPPQQKIELKENVAYGPI